MGLNFHKRGLSQQQKRKSEHPETDEEYQNEVSQVQIFVGHHKWWVVTQSGYYATTELNYVLIEFPYKQLRVRGD